MDHFINAEEHRAEISEMIHEICTLKNDIQEKDKQLNEKNKELLKNITATPENPFDNPTDYKGYSGEYKSIQPRLGEPGYKIPVAIEKTEYKKLKRQYSIGSWCIILHFVLAYVISFLLMGGVELLIGIASGNKDSDLIYNFMYGSSVLMGINMIVFLIANILCASLGLKLTGYKENSLIKTRDFNFGKGVQYCLIALFIWTISVYLGTYVEMIANKCGYTCVVNQEGLGESPLGLAVTYVYSCIIAPVTEEIMFRGMVLKVFSRANQRFGIFVSALFFGLTHGNIPQFILALFVGIFLAQITMKHNSIVPAAIVHIFINTMSTVFSLIADKSDSANLMATMVLFAMALVGFILFLVYRSEGNRLPAPTPQQHRRGRAVASGSIPFCLAIFIQVISMMMSFQKM